MKNILGKKNRRSSLDEYWKKKVHYNFHEEYIIYKYLCRWKLKKKEEISEAVRFNTYSQWREYVYTKYSGLKIQLLKEFDRYLNLEKREVDTGHGLNLNILIPIFIAVFGECILPYLIDLLKTIPPSNFEELMAIKAEWWIRVIFFILGWLLYGGILIVVLSPIVVILVWLILDVVKSTVKGKRKLEFYKDYREIIREIITNKEKGDA